MPSLRRSFRLSLALVWRSYADQGLKLVLLPLGFAAIIALLVLSTVYLPGALRGSTRFALQRAAELHLGLPGDSRQRLALPMAMLFIQGPYLAALFASMAGALTARASVGSEAARGGLELLLSAPYHPRELFLALLVSSLSLTLFSWAVLIVGIAAVAAVILNQLGVTPHASPQYLALSLLLPLPMALWANLIAFFLTLAFPRTAQSGVGTSTSLVQLLAILPGLAIFLLGTVRPDISPSLVAGIALIVGFLGMLGGVLLGGRWFRPAVLLEL